MEEAQTLCVLYASDDKYAKFLGISLLSLLKNNTAFDRIRVFIYNCGISEKNIKILKKIADDFNREITYISVDNVKDYLKLKEEIVVYSRLFIASGLPEEIERVFYIDCDTLVLSSLNEIWTVDFGNNLVAGVQDTIDAYFKKINGLGPDIQYINAGIMLINLKLWREENLEQRFIDYIRKYNGDVPNRDQGVINGVCGQRKYILPLRYNVISNVYSFSASTIKKIYFLKQYYSQSEIDEAIRNPGIVHFTPGLMGRPWEEDCTHPEKEEYQKYMMLSPWSTEPLMPSSQKRMVKVFKYIFEHIPLSLFETGYRSFSWILHIK